MQRSPLKDRILDFTEARLWEQGFRGLRVDELARDVGISKRTLYEQFRTKEEMAHDALGRRLQRLQSRLDEILSTHDDEADQVREIVRQICGVFAGARPPFFRDLETTPSLMTLVQDSDQKSHAKLEGALAEGARRGRFRADIQPVLARQVLLAAVDGVASGTRGHDEDSSRVLELIFRGLLA